MTYDQIMQWQRGAMAERVAADLASQIQTGKLSKWDALPLNRTLADKHNVSERTVSKAKRLLGGQGMLVMDGHRYYVALQHPRLETRRTLVSPTRLISRLARVCT
jgi:DNA-binding GntR family transcriptional regulator